MTWFGPWFGVTAGSGGGGGVPPGPGQPLLGSTLALVGSSYANLQIRGPIMIDLPGPIRVPRGDSLRLRMTVTDDDDSPVDITGYAIELEVKQQIDGVDPALIALSVGSGITILTQSGATKGQADITISSAANSLPTGLYWLDIVTVVAGIRTHVVLPREYTIGGVVNPP